MSAPKWEVIHGDCLDVMRAMPAASVDAVVCDPPYALTAGKKGGTGAASINLESPYGRARIGTGNGGGGFMGKAWDSSLPPVEVWIEALRVAKPGAHLLAFGGTRTFHRLTCAIEDAGWEIRDCLSFLYGSGFPKSHNFGCRCPTVQSERDYDSLRRVQVPVSWVPEDASPREGSDLFPQVQRRASGAGVGDARAQGTGGLDRHEPSVLSGEDDGTEQPGVEGRRDAQAAEGQLLGCALRQGPGVGAADGESGRVCDGASAGDGDRAGSAADSDGGRSPSQPPALGQPAGQPRTVRVERRAQAGGSDVCEKCGGLKSARGYGTALKPAWEPVILARKPLIGTVAANHAAHGTGALNIDGCRIAGSKPDTTRGAGGANGAYSPLGAQGRIEDDGRGRWPANVALDEDAAAALDEQSGERRSAGDYPSDGGCRSDGWGSIGTKQGDLYADTGGASRFFYTSKASRGEREAGLTGPRVTVQSGMGGAMPTDDHGRERDRFKVTARNTHPTVKPVDLMRWLVRLVTPVGGTVLDPFLGSGTTGVAALEEGCRFVGIEREAEYVAIARARIEAAARAPMLDFTGGAP